MSTEADVRRRQDERTAPGAQRALLRQGDGGVDGAEVTRLLGRPAKKQSEALKKDEEVWAWRYQAGAASNKVFSVTFDVAGKVIAVASADDSRGTMRGGPSSG